MYPLIQKIRFCFYSTGIGVAFLLILFSSPLVADTILLRNGTRIEGSITAQSSASVTVRTAGGTRTIPRGQIRRIAFGNPIKKKAPEKKPAAKKQPDPAELEKRRKEAEERQELLRSLDRIEPGFTESIGEIRSIRKEDVRFERNQALWRSILMPGWGQFHLDHYGRAVLFFGMAAALYSGWSNEAIELKRLESLYNNATFPLLMRLYFGNNSIPATYLFFNSIRKDVAIRESNLEIMAGLIGVVWTINILDVWYNHGEKFKLSLQLQPVDYQARLAGFQARSGKRGRVDIMLSFYAY